MAFRCPESTAKPMAKTITLNPNAEPFHIQWPPESSSLPSLTMVPPQEASFLMVCSQEPQLGLLPEPTQAVGSFLGYGDWYAHPLVAYEPYSSWFFTPNLEPVLGDNRGIPTQYDSDHGTVEGQNKGNISQRFSTGRKFPMGYGKKKKKTVARRDEVEWMRAKGAYQKSTEKQKKKSSGAYWTVRRPIVPFPLTTEEAERSATTTVMIRNIPNHYQFKDLLLILDDLCWELNKTADTAVWSKFDFVYLPMDYRKHSKKGRISNLGYAFVNFTSARAAFKFYQLCHGIMWDPENRKTCEITAAQFQGKDALMRIFHQKVFRCKSPQES